MGGLTAGAGAAAASPGGELWELERYELEFFRMPVNRQRQAMQGRIIGVPFGRSACEDGECTGECAVMMALTT